MMGEGLNSIEVAELIHKVVSDKTMTNHDHLFKLIIIGDTGVGKSCLLARAMDNEFKEEHNVTIGVEFGSFVVEINNKIVKLQIWDTAGQESFKSITRIFYKGAHCVFLTYDITRKETFKNVVEWLKEVKQNSSPDVLLFLVGNQIDLEEERQVTTDEAVELQKTQKIHYFIETSAKSGENVENLFVTAAKILYKAEKNKERERDCTGHGSNAAATAKCSDARPNKPQPA